MGTWVDGFMEKVGEKVWERTYLVELWSQKGRNFESLGNNFMPSAFLSPIHTVTPLHPFTLPP
jgi:hypothetical protein